MYRCGSGFLLIVAITFVAALTGCLGKSSGNSGIGGVQTVTLNPGGSLSLDVGGTQSLQRQRQGCSWCRCRWRQHSIYRRQRQPERCRAPLAQSPMAGQWIRLRRHLGPERHNVQCRHFRNRPGYRSHQRR